MTQVFNPINARRLLSPGGSRAMQKVVDLFEFLGIKKTQDGSHEPECSHGRLRWTGHNQITVHLSAFFVCAAMTNTCLQDLSPTLFSDTSLQHLAATLLFRTSLQHSSPTLLYNNLYNTFLQHLSTTLLSDTIFQHFSPAFL